MRPDEVRKAIEDGLTARAAWDGIDIWRYPPGPDRGEWKQGMMLGEIQGIDIAEAGQDLAGEQFLVAYEISGIIWRSKSGAKDADYAESEAAVLALILDFWRWIQSTSGGKTLSLANAVVDELALPLSETTFGNQDAAVLCSFVVDVAEVVTP